MGTELINHKDYERIKHRLGMNVLLKRFYGGKDRGACYSITFKNSLNDYIEITEPEFCYMIYKKLKNECEMIEDKDTLYDGHITYLNVIRPLIKYYEKIYGFK